jgi:hypothetical protein
MPEIGAITATASLPSEGRVVVTILIGTHRIAERGLEIDVRSALGFEILGADNVWHSTPIVTQSDPTDLTMGTLTLNGAPAGSRAIRYLWYTTPCTMDPYRCPVYVKVPSLGPETGERGYLPLGPFLLSYEY